MKLARILYALKHPRDAFLFLILGERRYGEFLAATTYLTDYNEALKNFKPETLIESCAIKITDINEHLVTLHMLAVEFGLKIILELGTRDGESTIAFLEAARKIGGHVYSVDIDPCLYARERIHRYGLNRFWAFIEADDLDLEWNKEIDLLFIDTAHTYEHTLKELQKYEPYVKPCGIIALHDTVTHEGVRKAIETYITKRNDLVLYRYVNNNGLAVLFKKQTDSLKTGRRFR